MSPALSRSKKVGAVGNPERCLEKPRSFYVFFSGIFPFSVGFMGYIHGDVCIEQPQYLMGKAWFPVDVFLEATQGF